MYYAFSGKFFFNALVTAQASTTIPRSELATFGRVDNRNGTLSKIFSSGTKCAITVNGKCS